MVYLKWFFAVSVATTIGGCTAPSAGSHLHSPEAFIELPQEGAQFAPGETLELRVALENFELIGPTTDGAEPQEKAAWLTRAHGDEGVVEGYYRVYLDGAGDDEALKTAWTHATEVPLPNDLVAGPHTLRVRLFDAEGPLDIEATVEIECVIPG